MRTRAFWALAAVALVAGCREQPDSNESNTVMPSAETRNAATQAAPLSTDQALALMKERHEHMEALGKATKKISNELKSSSPDVGAIRESAGTIARLAPDLQSWFPKGTGPDVGKTRAKSEVWKKPEDFTLKARDFRQAARQFEAAAQSGNMSRIRSSFEALGKSCKACHEPYREPEKD